MIIALELTVLGVIVWSVFLWSCMKVQDETVERLDRRLCKLEYLEEQEAARVFDQEQKRRELRKEIREAFK